MAAAQVESEGTMDPKTTTTSVSPGLEAGRGARDEGEQKPQRKRPQKPNYQLIHSKPLPLKVHPLPAFIPQNPLSLLRIASVLLQQFFSPPSSHPIAPITGIFNPETHSVHVTDPAHIRALWEMGFFGKGTLSRSEPSWLEREKARLKASKHGGGTAEENTRKRREERKLFKLERARAEAEMIEEQLRHERAALEKTGKEGSVEEVKEAALGHVFPWMQDNGDDKAFTEETTAVPAEQVEIQETAGPTMEQPIQETVNTPQNPTITEIQDTEISIPTNQEHLQLDLPESFFLAYALGSLKVISPSGAPIPTSDLLPLFRQHSHFPIAEPSQLRPDDPFLLSYVVYHHYRSLGWVVRPGVKFSCDFLLYNRGPVFSHAEFALLIIPEYAEGSVELAEGKGKMGWWWLHCVNRVQSQVKKSLVIVYVKVPKELPEMAEMDVGRVLRQYEVREFVVRRWLANRSRD